MECPLVMTISMMATRWDLVEISPLLSDLAALKLLLPAMLVDISLLVVVVDLALDLIFLLLLDPT
jgi:hypothetical protein